MKNFILLSGFLFIMVACDLLGIKPDDSDLSAGSNEILLPDSLGEVLEFEATGDTVEIEVYSALKCRAVAESKWVTVKLSDEGLGHYVMTVIVSFNKDYKNRESLITLFSDAVKKELLVRQKGVSDEGKDEDIAVNFDSIGLDAGGDEFSIKVKGSDDFNVECHEKWCTVNKTMEESFIQVTIEAEPNDSDTRNAEVVFKSESGTILHKINVRQLSVKDQSLSTEHITESRSSFLLIFTATWCPYSPLMMDACELVKDSWDKNIEIVNVHVTNSELYCEASRGLSLYYDNNHTPSGILDGRVKIEYESSQLILNALTEGETLNMGTTKIQGAAEFLDEEVICVNIKLTDIDEGSYSILTWVIEDNVVAGQEDISENLYHETFIHDNVLRYSLSDLLGDEFIVKGESGYKDLTYTSTIPDSFNKDNLRVMVILQKEAEVNGATFCYPYYVDNCISFPVGNEMNNGGIENIIIGDEIKF